MPAAGAVVVETLRMITEQAVAGHTTADLDRIAAEILAAHGAASPTAPPTTSTTLNGRTLRSTTGARATHSDHTVAVTADGVDGARILTLKRPTLGWSHG